MRDSDGPAVAASLHARFGMARGVRHPASPEICRKQNISGVMRTSRAEIRAAVRLQEGVAGANPGRVPQPHHGYSLTSWSYTHSGVWK